jgi:hypothetical protein
MAGATCLAGACTLGAKPCDDQNPCTTDTCDMVKGCQHEPAKGGCDDGDPCSGGDVCTGGTCAGHAGLCSCAGPEDCTGEGFDPCLGSFGCVAGNCKLTEGSAPECSGLDDGICMKGTCDPATGACQGKPLDDGTACYDGDPCTIAEACQSGICKATSMQNCDDLNPCTNDACKFGVGCVSTPIAGPCDDGNACTGNDACLAGVCGGAALVCVSGGPCLVAFCDPAKGCAESPLPNGALCDDGKPCFEPDLCQDGSCVSGDGCECQIDTDCQTTADLCKGTPLCDEGECQVDTQTACPPVPSCLVSTCVPAVGECTTAPATEGAPCDDQEPCSPASSCLLGVCQGDTSCEDQNPCTKDGCTGKGCVHKDHDGTPCTESEPCQENPTCFGGNCVTTPVVCNDGDLCSNDACGAGGCAYAPVSCDDGSACTTDSCAPATGCQHDAIACSQAGLTTCQVAACDALDGQCKSGPAPDGQICNDGESCTEGDVCEGGQCAGAANCDDGSPCTNDACVAGLGCLHTPVGFGVACDDGNPCTSGDGCVASTCLGIPLVCIDGDVCTDDSCAGGECVYKSNGSCQSPQCIGKVAGASCDDDDTSTSGDLCLVGICRGFTLARSAGSEAVGFRYFTTTNQHAGTWFVGQVDLKPDGNGNWGIVSSILNANDPVAPTAFVNTVHAQQFVAIHGGVAAAADGPAWQWADDGWSADTELAKAIVASSAGTVYDIWTHGEGSGLIVWLVGSEDDTTYNNSYLRRCTATGCATQKLSTLTARPMAVTGYCETGAGTADCALRLVLGADEAAWNDGTDYALKNHVFENAGGSKANWSVGYSDDKEQLGRSTRVTLALGDGQVLIAGEKGYIRQRYALGGYSYNLWNTWDNKDIEEWSFFAGWVGSGVIALTTFRSDGDATDLELWTCPVGGNVAKASSWTVHELGTESDTYARLYGIWGTSSGELRVVGAGNGDDDYSDGLIFVREP